MSRINAITILPESEDVGIFISGSAAARSLLYTCAQLEAQEKPYARKFSVYDNHEDKESKDIEEGRGFPLSDYLRAAGAEEAEEIRVRSVDGFESVLSEMGSKRYFFPELLAGSAAGSEPREAFLSFYKNGERVKFYPHPTVMFGQQGLEDKNKDFFAKGIRAVIAGGKDRAFWVKGDLLRCNRYYSLDEIFEFEEPGAYRMHRARITDADGSVRVVPAARIPWQFWEREFGLFSEESASGAAEAIEETATAIAGNAAGAKGSNAADKAGEERSDAANAADADGAWAAVAADGSLFPLPKQRDFWLFFSDAAGKHVGLYDGSRVIGRFAGFLAGRLRETAHKKEIRTPGAKAAAGDFYIRIRKGDAGEIRYEYSLAELRGAYKDLLCEEEYCYYNHNMNRGRGGNRLVTARGWKLADLLCLLPEIPDAEFLESGAVRFRVFTRDAYKEKTPLEGEELTAYRFLLAFEQDQRTDTGMEPGDTGAWTDAEKRFEPVAGSTPYRIYCGKSSANPAVYKNAAGIAVEIL